MSIPSPAMAEAKTSGALGKSGVRAQRCWR